jgi:hypothetical protein
LADTIISAGRSRGALPKIAAAGVLTGILTPLFQPLIDRIGGAPGDFRIALLALPFAILVAVLVRRPSLNPWWLALAAAVITMIAFVCAVNAAIWIDGQIGDVAKAARNICAGLAGGFVGAGVMALGIGLLPVGPRDPAAWLPMLGIGSVAGALGALSGLAGRRRGGIGDGPATDYGAPVSRYQADCNLFPCWSLKKSEPRAQSAVISSGST